MTKGLIPTTALQESILPRCTFSPQWYKGITYEDTHSNNTDTRIQPTNCHRIGSRLQKPTVLSSSFKQHRYKSPPLRGP